MGNKFTQTVLRIENHTNIDIVDTSATVKDTYDWYGDQRPDRNLKGLTIKPNGFVELEETINTHATNCPFTMTVHFRNGKKDVFTIHQKLALDCCAGFEHITATHEILYEHVGENTLRIIIKLTEKQLRNEEAERLRVLADNDMKEELYEAAIEKFEKALELASETKTIEAIKLPLSVAYNTVGKTLRDDGWSKEEDITQDNTEEAKACFDKAKKYFNYAAGLNQLPEYKLNAKITGLKVDADQIFNEAVKIEQEAYSLFKVGVEQHMLDNYDRSQTVYDKASTKYQQAKEKYDEGLQLGDKRFDDCSKMVVKIVKDISQVKTVITKLKLKATIKEQEALGIQ